MRPHLAERRRQEAGFTLAELLVVVAILGAIGFALTQAVLLGFKTTDKTVGNVSRSSAVQILVPYFTADVQSADLVAVTDPKCTTDPGVFLNLTWSDQGTPKAASYALDPPSGPGVGEQDLVRWACVGTGPATKRVLGHFSHDPAAPAPVSATCTPAPCSASSKSVTLHAQFDPSATPVAPIDLTVRRRTA